MVCACVGVRGRVAEPPGAVPTTTTTIDSSTPLEILGEGTAALALIVQGMLHNDFPESSILVRDTTLIVSHISDAVEHFAKMTTSEAVEGLDSLAEALRSLGVVLAQAGATEPELKRIAEAIDQLKHPKKFFVKVGQELVLNGKDIIGSVSGFVTHFHEKEWVELGMALADVIKTLTAPVPADAEIPWPFSVCCPTEAVAGTDDSEVVIVIEDRGISVNKESLVSMLQGLLPSDLAVKSAMQDRLILARFSDALAGFEKSTVRSTVNGLIELGVALDRMTVPSKGAPQAHDTACHVCDGLSCRRSTGSVATNKCFVMEFRAAAALLQNPSELMLAPGQSLKLNGQDFSGLVNSVVIHAREDEWKQVGGDIRAIVDKLNAPLAPGGFFSACA